MIIRQGRHHPCRAGFAEEVIGEALASLGRDLGSVCTLIAIEMPAPPGAAYRFGYHVTIDGARAFIGCFDEESGPLFAAVDEQG